MAAKSAKTGEKRKAASSDKASPKNYTAKKSKQAGPTRKPFDKEDVESDSESGFDSDSEEGDVVEPPPKKKKFDKLEKSLASRPKKANGETAAPKTAQPGTNSREAHAKQRQLAQERRAAKPLADELARTKKLWEKLRRKSHVPKEERQQLVEELFSIITGRVKDFVLKHDAVRAVQTAIKYATPAQRKAIARELEGTYAQLAESKYAKFLIGKLLVQNDNEIRDLIVPEFYGKVRKLVNHPEASWILDDIYRGVATKHQKAVLLREWYGPEFSLFGVSAAADIPLDADLGSIIQSDESKKGAIMKYLLDLINTLIQKKMTGFTILHDAMLQYFLNLTPGSEDQKEFMEIVKEDESGDLLKNMAFTKSGARLVCLLLAYGTAKDRKQLLKAYKDTFQLMCGDKHAHIVILAAYDLIDDTVLTSKTIFPEILGKNEQKEVENIIFCANDLNARTTVLYLFEGATRGLFPASHSTDLEILEEIHQIRKTTSKKDDETRRKELVAAASPHLLSAIAASPDDLVATSFGCQLVTDVLLWAVGDKSKALEAIAKTAEGDPDAANPEGTYPPPRLHISQTPFGGKMFRTLIAGGPFDRESGKIKLADPPLNFAEVLYPHIQEHIVAWATGPSSFVPLALLESADFSGLGDLRKILSENKKLLDKAATEETAEQKEKRETGRCLVKTESNPTKKGRRRPPKAEPAVGNSGARLLLEKLAA